MRKTNWTLITCAILALPGAVLAGQPHVLNTDVGVRMAGADLSETIEAVMSEHRDIVWIGYEVPCPPGTWSCCGDRRSSHCLCRLESESSRYHSSGDDDEDGILPPGSMMVLLRAEDREIVRLRYYSAGCELDADGVDFVWLTDVDPTASLALLEGMAGRESQTTRYTERVAEEAVGAIAMHEHPEAIGVMRRLTGGGHPEEVRKSAVFWTSQMDAGGAVEVIEQVLRNDPSDDVREQAIFALSQCDDERATDVLIQTARHDKDPELRENAVFWLSQLASDKVAETIADVIENDPDADVKQHAVFALSQLPPDRSIPELIRLARSNKSREVRKQAIFWLGQVDDDRALDFFEEVLSK